MVVVARVKEGYQLKELNISFSGGLNLSCAAWSIADNESPKMLNWIYNPESSLPEVRPGTSCQTASAAGSSIRALYLYEKSTTIKYIIGCYGSKIYYLSGATLNAWTEIGSIASATVVPEFLTVNNKLLIADGGNLIKTWDGTTYGTINDSPNASCLRWIKNRVAANHVGEPDSVYLSKTNDETVWDTTSTAIGLKAGYGDNLAVNGLAVFGDDLIISKSGNAMRKMYRLNTAATATTDWYVKEIPGASCAQNPGAIKAAFNNVFFFNNDGLRSLKGVQEYGDLQSDQTGRKVNSQFTTAASCNFLKYIPTYNSIWLSFGSSLYTGRMIGEEIAFTELYFNQGRIDSLCMDGTTIYLGGNNGYLYKIDDTKDTDEVTPGVTQNYSSILRSKIYNYGDNDLTLNSVAMRVTPISSGTFNLSVIKEDATSCLLDTVSIESEGQYLYDATGYLNDETGYLYDAGGSPSLEVNHNRVKSPSIQLELYGSGVRYGVDSILAKVMISKGSY